MVVGFSRVFFSRLASFGVLSLLFGAFPFYWGCDMAFKVLSFLCAVAFVVFMALMSVLVLYVEFSTVLR